MGGVHSKLLFNLWSSPGNQSRMNLKPRGAQIYFRKHLMSIQKISCTIEIQYYIFDCLERSDCLIKKRKRLSGVTVPPSKMHPGGLSICLICTPEELSLQLKCTPPDIFLSLILEKFNLFIPSSMDDSNRCTAPAM